MRPGNEGRSSGLRRALTITGAVVVAVVIVSVAGAAPASASTLPGPPRVIAAFNPVVWLAKQLEEFALWALGSAINWMQKSSEPNIGAVWFKGQYSLMRTMGVFITVPIVLLATISALFKGGLRAVLHTYLVGLPISILGAVIAIAMVSILQEVDQNMTDAVIGETRTSFQFFYDSLGGFSQSTTSIGILMVANVMFFVLALGGLALWIELIFRAVMIYLSVLFLPLAFAAYAWEGSRRWLFGLAEIVTTMIFAKFVIFSTLGFGFAAVEGGLGGTMAGGSEGWGRIGLLIVGVVIVVTAAFASPALITFVMRPNHAMADRKQLRAVTPLDGDRASTRQFATQKTTGAVKKVGSILRITR